MLSYIGFGSHFSTTPLHFHKAVLNSVGFFHKGADTCFRG